MNFHPGTRGEIVDQSVNFHPKGPNQTHGIKEESYYPRIEEYISQLFDAAEAQGQSTLNT